MYEMYIIIIFQISYWDSTELEGVVYCLTVEEIIEDINEGTLILNGKFCVANYTCPWIDQSGP